MAPLDGIKALLARAAAGGIWLVVGASALVFGFVAIVATIVGFLGFLTVIIVGAWDLLTWLTKSDWRTTHFQAPLVGAVVWVIGWIASAISYAIYERCIRAGERVTRIWEGYEPKSRLDDTLETYKAPDEAQD